MHHNADKLQHSHTGGDEAKRQKLNTTQSRRMLSDYFRNVLTNMSCIASIFTCKRLNDWKKNNLTKLKYNVHLLHKYKQFRKSKLSNPNNKYYCYE